jgi:REP element-mobilizing transposase RayT
VCVAKGRDKKFTQEVDQKLKEICLEIAKRYEIHFVEIGTDTDHVHFLIQSVPLYHPTKIVRIVKSLTARELLQQIPGLRKHLWGGEFWSNGYFINTVGRTGSETVIRSYVKNQGQNRNYIQLHKDQLKLF